MRLPFDALAGRSTMSIAASLLCTSVKRRNQTNHGNYAQNLIDVIGNIPDDKEHYYDVSNKAPRDARAEVRNAR